MSRILLLEDDESLGVTLRERLEKEQYTVEWVRSLADARALVAKQDFEVAILDIGLPDGTGFEFAQEVRARKGIPFLFLTAMASAEYRLQGYELGAEEFIPKPFHLKELLLRVRHVLENHAQRKEVQIGTRRIDFGRMAIADSMGGIEYLGAKDCEVLRMLVDNSPNVVSRDQILEKIWGGDAFPTNRTVDNVILRLRQVLKDDKSEFIRTVRGIGYQLILEKGSSDGE